MAILLPVECRKGLTFNPFSVMMHITMAEVAGSISTNPGQAIAVLGKGRLPKVPFACQAAVPGPTQNMRGTVVHRAEC